MVVNNVILNQDMNFIHDKHNSQKWGHMAQQQRQQHQQQQ